MCVCRTTMLNMRLCAGESLFGYVECFSYTRLSIRCVFKFSIEISNCIYNKINIIYRYIRIRIHF